MPPIFPVIADLRRAKVMPIFPEVASGAWQPAQLAAYKAAPSGAGAGEGVGVGEGTGVGVGVGMEGVSAVTMA